MGITASPAGLSCKRFDPKPKTGGTKMTVLKRIGLLAVAGSFLVFGSVAGAKTIKGTLVNVETAEKNIRNIAVVVKTDNGENRFQVTEQDMVDGLHMDEPVTLEVDDKGKVTKIIGQWNEGYAHAVKIARQDAKPEVSR